MAISIVTLAFLTSISTFVIQRVLSRHICKTKTYQNQIIDFDQQFFSLGRFRLVWHNTFQLSKEWITTLNWQGREWMRHYCGRGIHVGSKSLKRVAAFPWITAAIVTGVVLRLAGFTAAPIWYDEMFSLLITRQGLLEMIQSLRWNISPPGFEILLWFITRLFGWNEFSLRLISVLASIITLWVIYKITTVLMFSRLQKIASLALIAMLPYVLIAAQQGRVYALFELLYLFGLYSSLRGKWVWLGISICGMLWCHNISFLFIPGLILISVFLFPNDLKKILIVSILGLLAFLPWAKVFLYQTGIPTPWFVPITLNGFIYNFYVAFYGWNFPGSLKSIALIWIVFLILSGLLIMVASWLKYLLPIYQTAELNPGISGENLAKDNTDNSTQRAFVSIYARGILFIAFFLPFVFMIASSLIYKNVILYRTIFLLIPSLLLWLVHIFVPGSPNVFHKVIWSVSLILIFTGVFNWNPTQQGGNMRAFSQFVDKNFRPGDAFFHSTALSAVVFDYYFPDEENYLIDAQNVLGTVDLEVLKINIPRYASNKVPSNRLWVVWTHHEDLESLNKDAEEKVSQLAKKLSYDDRITIPAGLG